MNVGAVVIAILLLLLNGFFVAVEFALVASSRTKIEPLAEQGNRSARYALQATSDLTLQLAGAQLGITMASLALGFVGEPAVAQGIEGLLGVAGLPAAVTHTIAFVLALAIVVFLHMVIGEMVPKNLALTSPEKMLLALAVPNHFYVKAFRPVLWLLNHSANLALRPFGVEPADELQLARTPEEFVALIEVSHEEGLIAQFSHDLLTGALGFGATKVESVMTPRDRIVSISKITTVADAERIVVETGHSRFPVIGRDLDDVQGFIHSKDLLSLPARAQRGPVPVRMVRRMVVARTGWSLDAVLRTMRRTRVHFAVVLDDTGHTAGIVTLEDLLEELVGDIVDETDRDDGSGAGSGPNDPGRGDSRHETAKFVTER